MQKEFLGYLSIPLHQTCLVLFNSGNIWLAEFGVLPSMLSVPPNPATYVTTDNVVGMAQAGEMSPP